MCGGHTESRAGFAVELLRAWWWKQQAPQLDLTYGAPVRPAAFLPPVQAQFAGD
jgi:hypothetical protein